MLQAADHNLSLMHLLRIQTALRNVDVETLLVPVAICFAATPVHVV